MIKHFSLFLVALTAAFMAIFTVPTYAVDVFEPCDRFSDSDPNRPTVCKEKTEQQRVVDGQEQNPLFGRDGIITFIVNLLSGIAGIIAVIVIILGGLKFVTSGSNPQDVSNAREMIIYAAIGLVIAISAQLIVRLFLFNIT